MVHNGHGVANFFLRQASEQYKTCAQFLAHDLRQVITRAQTLHSLEGKFCLLPLNDCACFMRHSHVHDGHSPGVQISVHGLWPAF